jgi:DNA-binding MarR family transcriptional regulator
MRTRKEEVSATAEADRVVAEVARLFPAMYRRFKAPARPVGDGDLTPRMLTVVHHLAGSGPLTVGEQAEHLGLSPATTSELVDRLETRGLVKRIRDERDRRRVFVWLTEDGRRRARAQPRVLAEDALLTAVRRMRPDDRAALVHGMAALLAAGEETG